jgi:hypothetical protein
MFGQPRSVSCRDAVGRAGAVAVIVRAGEAVLTVPPGEAARMTGGQLSELIDALGAARAELLRIGS